MKLKRKKEQPEISTSSLPDIVFMLLFFFMVVTVIKSPLAFEMVLSEASNIKKLERKDSKLHLFLGSIKGKPQIQLNDQLFSYQQLHWQLNQLPPEAQEAQYMVILEVDQELDMGPVMEVQALLREKGLLKIVYKTRSLRKEI